MKLETKVCTICEGRKILSKGAWDFDPDTCPHCKGTGKEPIPLRKIIRIVCVIDFIVFLILGIYALLVITKQIPDVLFANLVRPISSQQLFVLVLLFVSPPAFEAIMLIKNK